MGAPSSLATLYTFPHSAVRYNPSTRIIKYQGVKSNPPTRMSHTYYYLTSSFRWKTPMTTLSATGLWAYNIKAIFTTWNLELQGLQPFPHLPSSINYYYCSDTPIPTHHSIRRVLPLLSTYSHFLYRN